SQSWNSRKHNRRRDRWRCWRANFDRPPSHTFPVRERTGYRRARRAVRRRRCCWRDPDGDCRADQEQGSGLGRNPQTQRLGGRNETAHSPEYGGGGGGFFALRKIFFSPFGLRGPPTPAPLILRKPCSRTIQPTRIAGWG